jgi:hypothetical protein
VNKRLKSTLFFAGAFAVLAGAGTRYVQTGGLVQIADSLGVNRLSVNSAGAASTLQTLGTTNGWSTYRNINLGTTGVNIKGSAGQVGGWFIANRSAAERVIKFYNKATAPTVGTDTPALTITLDAGTRASVPPGSVGINFSSGIGIGASAGLADNDSTAPSSNDVVVNVYYN